LGVINGCEYKYPRKPMKWHSAIEIFGPKNPTPATRPHKHMALVQSKTITCAFDGHTLKKKTRAGQVLPLGRKPPFEGTKKLEERQV